MNNLFAHISLPDFIRFMSKVDTTTSVDGCWVWTGHHSGNGRGGGYGRFCFKCQTVAAHRWIYKMVKGKIRKGNQIDHKCCNRLCVNPNHLEQVSPSTNQKRKWKNINRKQHEQIKQTQP